jgi:hypothetical protein
MKRSLVILTSLCLLLGCATYPPPKIEGNRYENYRHGFRLELPGETWQPTDKLPAWLPRSVIAEDVRTSTIKLVLFNNEANAFIMVECYRSRVHILALDKDKLRKSFHREYQQIEGKALQSDQVIHYDYNVWPEYDSSPDWWHEADIVTDIQKMKVIAKGKMYSFRNNPHFITITLASDRLTFDENRQVFDRLYKSFEYICDIYIGFFEGDKLSGFRGDKLRTWCH